MNCYLCKEPLTSDDFKLDKVEEVANLFVHKDCFEKAQEKFMKDINHRRGKNA